jgi:hypothetical protein
MALFDEIVSLARQLAMQVLEETTYSPVVFFSGAGGRTRTGTL